jgi:Arc/MetJ-type ribon-helix-helix transcriptional regulator
MSDRRISIRLDNRTRRWLQQETQATGKNASEVVREALAAYIQGRPPAETCLDLARRHRLLGSGKGLPADLSANREHFEGFGR